MVGLGEEGLAVRLPGTVAAEGGLDALPEGFDGGDVLLLDRMGGVAGLDESIGQALQVRLEFREVLIQAVPVLVGSLARAARLTGLVSAPGGGEIEEANHLAGRKASEGEEASKPACR